MTDTPETQDKMCRCGHTRSRHYSEPEDCKDCACADFDPMPETQETRQDQFWTCRVCGDVWRSDRFSVCLNCPREPQKDETPKMSPEDIKQVEDFLDTINAALDNPPAPNDTLRAVAAAPFSEPREPHAALIAEITGILDNHHSYYGPIVVERRLLSHCLLALKGEPVARQREDTTP